ncbi:MAG: DUF4274 domain-containing protein [Planctomycetaceae bacterium]|nr:DUF4274 domain-containing protein [Planctomycetaceae bacterium]
MMLSKNDPVRRWLEQATPEFRHLFVAGWESEAAAVVFDWVIRQPDCEKATALMAYLLSSPVFLAEHGSPEQDDASEQANYSLLTEIEKRYLTGFYQQQSVGFDPSAAFPAKIDLTEGYKDIVPVQPIPEEMFVPVAGKELIEPEGWENGMPADVYRAWTEYIESEGWKRLPD